MTKVLEKQLGSRAKYVYACIPPYNVDKVEATSKDLLDKSMENEKLFNDLHAINGAVSESMKQTTDIAQNLSDVVQEIGVTLKLISDISSSTNRQQLLRR